MESHTSEPGTALIPLIPFSRAREKGILCWGDTPRPPAKGLAPLCPPGPAFRPFAKRPDLSPATQTRFSHTPLDLIYRPERRRYPQADS